MSPHLILSTLPNYKVKACRFLYASMHMCTCMYTQHMQIVLAKTDIVSNKTVCFFFFIKIKSLKYHTSHKLHSSKYMRSRRTKRASEVLLSYINIILFSQVHCLRFRITNIHSESEPQIQNTLYQNIS